MVYKFTPTTKKRSGGILEPFRTLQFLQKVVVKMTIEIALVISAISLGFAIYSGVSNLKRNNKQDAKSDSAQLTTVIVKLENIDKGINEIKADVKDVKNDLKDHSDRLIRLEQQVKVLNKTVFGKDDNNED